MRRITVENFEKPPKTTGYGPKVYKEWGRKRGKSKFSVNINDEKGTEVT